jgi:hypothetical protein
MYLKSQESQGQERNTIQGAYGQGYASASSDAKPHDAFFCAPARHQSPQAEARRSAERRQRLREYIVAPGAYPGVSGGSQMPRQAWKRRVKERRLPDRKPLLSLSER